MDSGDFTWTVDSALLSEMKQSRSSNEFPSPMFHIAGFPWQLTATPSVYQDDFVLSVKVMALPAEWERVECWVRIECKETMASYTRYFPFEAESKSMKWPPSTMLLSETQPLRTLSFTVSIFVRKIVLKEDGQTLFGRDAPLPVRQCMAWTVDREIVEKIKSAHRGKRFSSSIFGDVFCFELNRYHSKYFGLFLKLCAVPNAQPKREGFFECGVTAKIGISS